MKKRINWIDLVRAIAMIYVVLGHTLNGGIVENYIYSFHIALFFIISGFLYEIKEKKISSFIKNKFKGLMIPYYTFGIISIIIYKIFGSFASEVLGRGSMSSNIIDSIKGLLYGNAKTGLLKYNLPLWFLPCLFITSIIFYFIIKNIKKEKILFMMPFIFGIIGYILTSKLGLKLPLGIETSINMSVFFSIGYLIKIKQDEIKKVINNKNISLIIMITFLIIGGIIGIKNGRIRYSGDVYNNLLLFYSSSLLSSIGYIILSIKINRLRFLEYVGQKTLPILVMHKMPILVFQTVIFKKPLMNNNIIIAILVSVFSIILCLIADLVIDKYLPFLYGKSYKKTKKV